MPLISVADYRKHDPDAAGVEDAAIQQRLDANEAEIVWRYGPHDSVTEVLATGGGYVFPSRPVSSITSITEEVSGVVTTLDPTDYELLDGGRTLWRRSVGAVHPASRWGLARVTYVPIDSSAIRVGVVVDLTKTDLRYNGLVSWSKGEWTEVSAAAGSRSREGDRRTILSRLMPGLAIS